MKVLAVFLALVVAIQATPLKELVRELLELSEEDKRSVYMVQTKDGAIKADLQTTNMAGCGNGCAFVASVENMRTGDVQSKELVYPGTFEFTHLSTTDYYKVKACEKANPKACGTIIYCKFNTGSSYTTKHGCSATAPDDMNNINIINQIRSLLDKLQ